MRALLQAALAVTFVLGLLPARSADAHEVRPAYLQITEHADGTVVVVWKAPALGSMRLDVDPVLPKTWAPVGPPTRQVLRDAFVDQWTVRPSESLDGAEVSATSLSTLLIDVLVRVERADGRRQTGLLHSASPTLTLLTAPPASDVIATYGWMGMEHIWLGFDHLAFVFGLLLLVPGWKLLLQAITAFTVAHSLTLALTVFGVIGLAPAPVETVIAASILLLALEVLRKQRGEESLTTRTPWVVAFVFGLIHGAGFAGALVRVGLPAGDIPLALLCFNCGVELGQLAFVATILALLAAGRRLPAAGPVWGAKLAPYVLGSLAVMWCLERLPALFS